MSSFLRWLLMKLASDSCFLKYPDLHRTSAHKKNCSTFMRQNGYLFMTLIVIAPWLCWLDTVQKHSICTSWWEKSTTAEITNCLCEWCMQTMNFARMHRNAVSILTLRVSFKIDIPNKIDGNWFSLLMLFSCMLEESIRLKFLCAVLMLHVL
jgi:hypothetical protein